MNKFLIPKITFKNNNIYKYFNNNNNNKYLSTNYRTKYCGDINNNNIGENVMLSGWLQV